MPSRKRPCVRCKERHEKCDEARPRCARCVKSDVECLRPERELRLRRADSEAQFSQNQSWVSSRARRFKLDRQTRERINSESQAKPSKKAAQSPNSPVSAPVDGPSETHDQGLDLSPDAQLQIEQLAHHVSPNADSSRHESISMTSGVRDHLASDTSLAESSLPFIPFDTSLHYTSIDEHAVVSPYTPGELERTSTSASNRHRTVSFGRHSDAFSNPPPSNTWDHHQGWNSGLKKPPPDVQEACLLRYFVEEIAAWFDLCDDDRCFQRIIAPRAHSCPPLRHAICAVSACLVTRLPRRPERRGMSYLDPVIPFLHTQSAYEYMLLCIPALRDINDIQEGPYLENLAAAALILRQFEEITLGDRDDDKVDNGANDHVNFLTITDTILRSATNSNSPLMNAVYWVAIRQETYFSFYVGRAPEISTTTGRERTACLANWIILFAADVARWKYGDKSFDEWERLQHLAESLEKEASLQFIPLLQRPTEWSKGELFPVTWYGTDLEVTAMQHFLLAKSVLIAEDPTLATQGTRSAYRNAEHQVRLLILELCGLALQHLRMPTNLVTAGIGITLYGEFFSDAREREALEGVLEKWTKQHAWPTRRAYLALGLEGKDADSSLYQ